MDLKRALGQRFDPQTRTLESLDRFLQDVTKYPVLNAAAFQAWCQTQEHVASGVRRVRMHQVYNFCLYRRRTEPHCFVPDSALSPKPHQRLQPYIFSEQEVAELLHAASGLRRVPSSPLRPEMIRLAIVLLFTTGIRRGELLRLTVGDYDRRDATLLIRESKFYKSRLLSLNGDIAEEVEHYLCARAQQKLPVSSDTALICNALKGGRAYCGTTLGHSLKPLLQHGGSAFEVGGGPVDDQPLSRTCQPGHDESVRESGFRDETEGDCTGQTGSSPIGHTVEQRPHSSRLAGVSLTTKKCGVGNASKPQFTGPCRSHSTFLETSHYIT